MSSPPVLLPASFRGVSFGVTESESAFGRRVDAHQYPFRDTPWVEDLGRSARRIRLHGFLVTDSLVYGGGDVQAQRDRLVAACEKPGAATLVHPTLGTLTQVFVPSGGLVIRERLDVGRMMEFELTLIEAGSRQFPDTQVSTSDALLQAATSADTAAATDFTSRLNRDLPYGSAAAGQIAAICADWTAQLQAGINNATMARNLVAGLPGNFGRFSGGALTGFLASAITVTQSQVTVTSLIAQAAQARARIATLSSGLNTAATTVSASSGFPAQTQTLVAALLAIAPNPADGLQVLGSLAAYTPQASSATGAVADLRQGTVDLFHRATVVAATRAAANYQPSSYDDAIAVRARVTALLDVEIQVAGDKFDQSYAALRALRVAVVQHLNARGARLAAMRTYAFGATLPSLYLAHRLYQDAGREQQLTQQVNPRHPAFMPATFRALAS